MPAKMKIKEEPPIVEDVAPAAGLKAAARLSAVPTAKAGEAGAVKDGTPDWRGTCVICLDLLPIEADQQRFYSCCCKRLCTECLNKCLEYDERCPLCREPVPKSAADVVSRLQKRVDEGNADAQVMLGDAYHEGGLGLKKSVKRALPLYEASAAQGNFRGQMQLALSYILGSGVKINLKTAAQWYRRAADQGYPVAQSYLGDMFYHGEGVAQSNEEALKWYRLAAAQGNADALYTLGVYLATGRGVPRDYEEALRCFKRAAAQGLEAATRLSADRTVKAAEAGAVKDGTPADGVEASARLPAGRATAAAKASGMNVETPDWCGTCTICFDLLPVDVDRQMFYDCCCKKGMAQSYDEVVKWFRLAAAQGHDKYEAVRFYIRATAMGHAGAAEMAVEISRRLMARASG
ncbi:hypothetical protein M885DRAFT_615939 [Pelagophyceae sp. CCMP2097]|nr:hypothetical protein M885DRAFT_615939 [Pelagophyceae sp. CCMP2097]